MIVNLGLYVYISFVMGFAVFYIFVGHKKWFWTKKVFGVIVATLIYAFILPAICGMYMGKQFVEELEKE